MSDNPQWTIDEDSGRFRYEPDPVISLEDITNYLAMKHDPGDELGYVESLRPAYDALAQCVRDTETLAKARELARKVVDGREGGSATRESAFKAEVTLLRLLVEDDDQ